MLYIFILYEKLAVRHPLFIVIRFADNTNLLSVGLDTRATYKLLEAIWVTCQRWAIRHGMEFAPKKSELMHFIRAREPLSQEVRLGNATVSCNNHR